MRNSLLIRLIVGTLIFLSSHAQAVILSLNPNSSQAANGEIITLDLTISDLGASAAPSISSFDFDIAYDMTSLLFNGYSMGNLLGDISMFEAEDWSSGDAGGSINLMEISYLLPTDLHILQSDSFVLASLDFTVSNLPSNSSTLVNFSAINSLTDQDGNEISDVNVQNATISNTASTSIPEPAIWLLFVFGLVTLGHARAARR